MFPIRDDNPQLVTPLATYMIVAGNLLVWFLIQGAGSEPALAQSVCRLGLIPGELLQTVPAGTRTPLGPDTACALGGSATWHTPLTSMFMHGGWFHLLGNLWFLWIFGGNVEDAMGSARFTVFYLLCGFTAAALQIAANPSSAVPMVGASGAIGGVMGAYVLLYPRVHVHMLVFFGFFITTIAVPAVLMLGYWLLLQVVGGLGSLGMEGGGVAFWAHVGGFVGGGALVFVFRKKALLDAHPHHGWKRDKTSTRSWRRVSE